MLFPRVTRNADSRTACWEGEAPGIRQPQRGFHGEQGASARGRARVSSSESLLQKVYL